MKIFDLEATIFDLEMKIFDLEMTIFDHEAPIFDLDMQVAEMDKGAAVRYQCYSVELPELAHASLIGYASCYFGQSNVVTLCVVIGLSCCPIERQYLIQSAPSKERKCYRYIISIL